MSDRLKLLAKIVIGLVFIQAAGLAARKAVFLFIDRTLLSDTVVSAAIMSVMLAIGIIVAVKKVVSLSVFPSRHRPVYIAASAVTVALTVSYPFITGEISLLSVTSLVYSVILTPVFEELIFRGYA